MPRKRTGPTHKVKTPARRGQQPSSLNEQQRTDIARQLLQHPVRLRIVAWLAGQGSIHTQREIGKALSLSNAAVHYHLKRLERAGMVTLEGMRPGPNSITEKLYGSRPDVWREAVKLNEADRSAAYLDYALACMAEMHREGAELAKADWQEHPFGIGCYEAYASPEDVRRLTRRLLKIVEAFHREHGRPGKGRQPVAITLGLLGSGGAGWSGAGRAFSSWA
ncbi:MAG: helix-turn-helix transcriptional regulator [Phycisphaerae bacterium]|nr:helix-turn-helix transcriptional regulator [Phycisphaerae bacterium]